MRILVVEDEHDLNKILVKRLSSLSWAVDSCFNGEEALDYIALAEYDIIIMDVTMPKLNGFETVKRLRESKNNTPVIFLTARDSVADRVQGLDMLFCDYLVKPFSFDELAARIRAGVRKNHGTTELVYTVADLTLNTNTKVVERAGKRIELSAKEYAVLEYLMRNRGAILSREKIENNVWNFDYEGGSNVVDVYIRYLRTKIDSGFDKPLIHTVRGFGYVLKEEV